MELTTINTSRHRGVYLNNKKVRTAYLDYLATIKELHETGEQVTSRKVTDSLGKSRSAVETLKTLEDLDYIQNEEVARKGKNWKLTELGTRILNFSQN